TKHPSVYLMALNTMCARRKMSKPPSPPRMHPAFPGIKGKGGPRYAYNQRIHCVDGGSARHAWKVLSSAGRPPSEHSGASILLDRGEKRGTVYCGKSDDSQDRAGYRAANLRGGANRPSQTSTPTRRDRSASIASRRGQHQY